ncbi:MAG: hypothetical protein GC182_08080 [Rhodopseudomonas sp.]|nr:hypothetical protein [Rhodopseudomonas sp.]
MNRTVVLFYREIGCVGNDGIAITTWTRPAAILLVPDMRDLTMRRTNFAMRNIRGAQDQQRAQWAMRH